MARIDLKDSLTATNSGPRPGDFPLGSLESRVAARVNLERRLAGQKRQDFIVRSSIPRPRGDGITIGKWSEGKDGTLTRFSILPGDMTMKEAERTVANRGLQHGIEIELER